MKKLLALAVVIGLLTALTGCPGTTTRPPGTYRPPLSRPGEPPITKPKAPVGDEKKPGDEKKLGDEKKPGDEKQPGGEKKPGEK